MSEEHVFSVFVSVSLVKKAIYRETMVTMCDGTFKSQTAFTQIGVYASC